MTTLPALDYPPVPSTDIETVAILFSGGPAPAANAVIASAAACFSRAGVKVLGIRKGYSRLMKYEPDKGLKPGEDNDYVVLENQALEGKRTTRGIMIGTARDNPGKEVTCEADLDDPKCNSKLKTVYQALMSLEVDALISIGGDDTLTTAAKFKLFMDRLPPEEKRIRVIHLPKTIDNDYQGIDFTFGYFSAVEMLATEVRNLLADAMSTGAYYFAQVMGRKAGWLAYGAAIAGEASLVISWEDIPAEQRHQVMTRYNEGRKCWEDIPKERWAQEGIVAPATDRPVPDGKTRQPRLREVFQLQPVVDRIVDTILARDKQGKPYGVIVMAEGLGEYLPLEELRKCAPEEEFKVLKPDAFGHFPVSQVKFVGHVARLVNAEYKRRTATEKKEEGKQKKISSMQLGYEVRCHRPTAFDVILGSQLGVGAYRALMEKNLDAVMVSVTGQLVHVFPPFKKLIDYDKLRAKERLIEPTEDFHQLARYLEVR